MTYKVKRETDVRVSLGTNQWTLSLRLVSGHKHNFCWIFFLFLCVCVFFCLCFWCIDVVWQTHCVASAKRINLKFSLNKLQRKESHGRSDGKSVCLSAQWFVYMYLFRFNVCAYMCLSSSAQSGFICVHVCVY